MFRCVFALVAALSCAPVVLADDPKASECPACAKCCSECSPALSYKVISLADLGDAEVGHWILQAIPQVIAAGTWGHETTACTSVLPGSPRALVKDHHSLNYYPPARLLVVAHTPAVQAEVEAFVNNIRKSMPASNKKMSPPSVGVVQAHHVIAAPTQVEKPAAAADTKKPANRHRFQISLEGLEGKASESEAMSFSVKSFSVVYEGDGIIDNNIVELIKAQGVSDLSIALPGSAPQAPVLPGIPLGCPLPFNLPPGVMMGPQGMPMAQPVTNSGLRPAGAFTPNLDTCPTGQCPVASSNSLPPKPQRNTAPSTPAPATKK